MGTVWRYAAESTWEEFKKEKPGAVPLIESIMRTMRKGGFPNQAVFGQKLWWIDIVDAWAFSKMLAMLESGEILFRSIELGFMPGADREIGENNLKLSALSQPYDAKFWGRAGDSDGFLDWSEPLLFMRFNPEENKLNTRILEPFSLPLEVGYTAFETTFFHLILNHGVARWPYNMTSITLLYWDGLIT